MGSSGHQWKAGVDSPLARQCAQKTQRRPPGGTDARATSGMEPWRAIGAEPGGGAAEAGTDAPGGGA
eukprot:CAMPEP_0119171956 /NCGR_PEP_ID=MMETSP1315-20130426/26861_1 /TAXON_ID=676789 /ORGANISM="Prasinoderma singularis, Strain RCC927" /LENGTH=66 /DNA_ID=CAMNT_0007165825 /DNA_START=181 /DNA_END=377 /DNA_ORIENTATION=+